MAGLELWRVRLGMAERHVVVVAVRVRVRVDLRAAVAS